MNESLLLTKAITDPRIRSLAGDRYYQRGLDYFQRGHVVSIEVFENTIQAVVRGTESYAVEITAKSNLLDFQCECPLGEDNEFCKHCVATALAWLHRGAAGPEIESGGKTRRKTNSQITALQITEKEIARVLDSTDKATLVALILEWLQEEPGLYTKLKNYTALAMGPEAAVHQATLSLQQAIRIRRFVDYHEAGGYAGTVHSAIDLVEQLLISGHALLVIQLCETALHWLAAATGNIDDSDGQMTELMERLQQIHLRACEAARPDPVELAGRLFRAELLAEYGEFHGSAETYADILGPKGLQAFRKLADEEWANVPVRIPEQGEVKRRRERLVEGRNGYSITSIMMSLARQSGDVEQVVSILERDLASAYQYLLIAEAYRRAGNADKALEWAERGVAAFPERTDGRLRLFLAEEYQGRGRHQEAIRTVWLEFLDHASLDSYKLLEQFARKDDDWDEWRQRALRHIRRDLESKPDPKRANAMVHSWAHHKRDHSLLVEIFLYKGKFEEAWQEARDGGCSDGLWLRLAKGRETTMPEEAIPVYLRLAEAGILNAPNHRYDDAVKLLERAAQLRQDLGQGAEFRGYLDTLRKTYKAKRNFQKLIEGRRRELYFE